MQQNQNNILAFSNVVVHVGERRPHDDLRTSRTAPENRNKLKSSKTLARLDKVRAFGSRIDAVAHGRSCPGYSSKRVLLRALTLLSDDSARSLA